MTNFEKITQSPETLMKTLRHFDIRCGGCPVDEMFCEANAEKEGGDCTKVMLRWLKQEAREDRRK